MLKLSNISKIYHTKYKEEVKALDDVSITFPNRGMVFIVGKSGSGKSTLLNIITSLDKPDKGEVIIDNKSMNSFVNSDFDNYRNTYVGIIFQEFNLLEQYTVEENLTLVLKMQNKEIDQTIINEILSKVELDGLSKRFCNELSGGQRQRLAIARALIKNPKVIIADEPTGNLDSKTSEQIFSLLKKISKNHLVIIVSHDIEAANKYSDSTIQLADGRVINTNLKIDENDDAQLSLIKAKLPFIFMLKMALKNFKEKWKWFALTIIISTIAFSIFGSLSSTVHFNETAAIVNSLHRNKDKSISIAKEIFYKEEKVKDLFFNQSELQTMREQFKEHNFYTVKSDISGMLDKSLYQTNQMTSYHIGEITGCIEYSPQLIHDFDLHLLAGRWPNINDINNEIAIPYYIYEHFFDLGYMNYNEDDTTKEIKIDKVEQIIDKHIYIEQQSYLVVGIVDTHIPQTYQMLKQPLTMRIDNNNAYKEFMTIVQTGIHSLVFVAPNYKEPMMQFGNLVYMKSLPISNGFIAQNNEKLLRYDFISTINFASDIHFVQKETDSSGVVLALDSFKKEEAIIIQHDLIRKYCGENYLGLFDNSDAYYYYIVHNIINEFSPTYNYDYFFDLACGELIKKYFPTEEITIVNGMTDYAKNYPISGINFADNSCIYFQENEIDNFFDQHLDGRFSRLIVALRGRFKDDYELIDYLNHISLNTLFINSNNELVSGSINYNSLDIFTEKLVLYSNVIDSLIMICLLAFFLIFAFASILLYHFIYLSIKIRYRDMAVLRSLGLSHFNLKKIFIIEGIMISGIITILSFPLSLVYQHILNNYLLSKGLIELFPILPIIFIYIFLITNVTLIITTLSCLTKRRFANLNNALKVQ